ncbi:hypothetical protein AKJ16_DCAP10944 [Drosera capensis]
MKYLIRKENQQHIAASGNISSSSTVSWFPFSGCSSPFPEAGRRLRWSKLVATEVVVDDGIRGLESVKQRFELKQ